MAKKLKRKNVDRLYAAEHPGCTDFVIGTPSHRTATQIMMSMQNQVKTIEGRFDLTSYRIEDRLKLLEEDMDAVQRELTKLKKEAEHD